MKSRQKVTIAILVVLALAAAFFLTTGPFRFNPSESAGTEVYTCPMHPSVRSDRPGACPVCGMALVKKSRVDTMPDEIMALSLSRPQRVVANISTVPVRRGEMTKELRVVGLVSFAEPLRAAVAARFRGRIEVLHADFTGRRVEKNDPLFEMYSPDLISAQREFLLALGNQQANGLLETSGMNRELLVASRERLKVHFGLTADQVDRLEQTREVRNTVTFHSPISGTVIRKAVVEGEYVEEGMTLYELADLSTVWITFDMYERDLPFVSEGQMVAIMSEAYPGKAFTGRVTFIDPVLNPETRTVRIRTEAENSAETLKPNMYVTGLVKKTKPGALLIPNSAILSTGTRNIVWVEAAENSFEPRSVVVGVTNDSLSEIIEGLREGEMVASSGGYLIDSESALREPSLHAGNPQHDHRDTAEQHGETGFSSDVHIRVAGGYLPRDIHLRKGVATRLHFLREESSRCTEEVVLRDFGLRALLPQGTPVTLEITPGETGEFVFSCGMNMIHGKIVVHE